MTDDILTAQLLRLLARDPRTRDDLARRTAVPDDALDQLLAELTRRGWIETRGEHHALTAAGAAHSRWSTQLLLGGPIDPAGHLHAAEESRTRERRQQEAEEEAHRRHKEADKQARRHQEEAEEAQRHWAEAQKLAQVLHTAAQPPQALPVVSPRDPWWALREARRRRSARMRSAQPPPRTVPTPRRAASRRPALVVLAILGTLMLVAGIVLTFLDVAVAGVVTLVAGALALAWALDARPGRS